MTEHIETLIKRYGSGEGSAVSTTTAILERIENSTLNAFISVLPEKALAEASALDGVADNERRALHGVAVAIKDLIDVEGYATTMGAEGYEGNIAQTDAEVVRRLRAAGAVIIGKTNTHQFAYGPMGDRSAAGPVLNPHNEQHMTGGSSSGSAAAVAAGLAHVAVGSDTAASVRLPAAFCGVVGMKPTMGLVPSDGTFPLSKTLDHLGPISVGCRDNARLLAVMAGREPNTYSKLIDQPVDHLTVGLPSEFFNTHWSECVTKAMERAVRTLRLGGVRVKAVSIPGIQEIYDAQQTVLRAEAYALHAPRIESGAPYEEEVRERLLAGKGVSAAAYEQALATQPQALAAFDAALEDVDVILTPTCGITAPRLQERSTVLNGETVPTRWLLTRLTAPTNFSGHPSLSVPFGKDTHKLPIGVQLIGKYHAEAMLYQLGDFLTEA